MRLVENSAERVVLEESLPRYVYWGWAVSSGLGLVALAFVVAMLLQLEASWPAFPVAIVALILLPFPAVVTKRRKRLELDRAEKRLTYEEWTLLGHDERKGRVHDVTFLSTGRVNENPRLKLKHDEWRLGVRAPRSGADMMNALRPLRDALREAGARI